MPDSETHANPCPESDDPASIHQDAFRKVYLGQISDPLYPRHPGPSEMGEEELTRAALEDPAAVAPESPKPISALWRIVFLMIVALVALAIIFIWRK
ncbi:MAG TPA: hypothetical protein PKL14_01670 [Holophaga sp.]|jgi:hypothetical protein|nr:hypothetical protein [Holophaga sp.]